jgi:hypothetical protein
VIQINVVIISYIILAILLLEVDEIIWDHEHGFQRNKSTMIKYVAFIRYRRRDGNGTMGN